MSSAAELLKQEEQALISHIDNLNLNKTYKLVLVGDGSLEKQVWFKNT